jgi:DNA repair protein RadC
MNSDNAAVRELTLRYAVKRDAGGGRIDQNRTVTTPRESAQLLMPLLEEEPCDVFALLLLSTRHRVLAYYEVSRGTLDSTLVHPREVFKAAILANAAAIILAHVHPSGDPTPSADDRELTRRLSAAGTLLGIQVLDHIIVGHDRYVSFKELGLL